MLSTFTDLEISVALEKKRKFPSLLCEMFINFFLAQNFPVILQYFKEASKQTFHKVFA